MATGQGVYHHIEEAGQGHQATGYTEVGLTGCTTTCSGHTTGGKWQRQDNIHQRIDNHVNDDSVETVQTFLLATAQLFRLLHTASEVEEHDRIEHNGAEFGKENPEVVTPETFVFILGTHPALSTSQLIEYQDQ